MLVLTALSLLNVGLIEFGPRHDRAIQVDELYFAACAARGTAAGEILVAGCHDNKTPLIFALHQLVQRSTPPYYDVHAVKVAAFVTVALVCALVGYLAFRLAGGLAAASAVALLAQVFAYEAPLIALKTDTTGAVFLLVSLALLLGPEASPRLARIFAAGCMLGMALLVKQTYAFAALGVYAWLLAVAIAGQRPWLATFLRRGLVFGLGVLGVFGLCLLIFVVQDRQLDFLSSAVLYPSIHGSGNGPDAGKHFVWKLASIFSILADTPLVVVAFTVAAAGTIGLWAVQGNAVDRTAKGRLLIVSTALAMLAMLLMTPTFFDYHLIPAWALMAICGGVAISDAFSSRFAESPRATTSLATGLLVSAVLMSASSWTTNGSRKGTVDTWTPADVVGTGSGEYAYVLGTWPDFYVYNGLVPASDVLFPWALPGAPGHWGFTLPDPDSLRGRWLAAAHDRNIRKLIDDFGHTPPRYIVVIDEMARSSDSGRVSDVPGFDEYLIAHCGYMRAMTDSNMRPGKLFGCGPANPQESVNPRLAP